MTTACIIFSLCFILLGLSTEQMIATTPETEKSKRVLREVPFEGGIAQSGSSSGKAECKNAFTSNQEGWISGKRLNDKLYEFPHLNDEFYPFPHLIWYDFVDRRVLPARVLFYTKTANIILFKEDQLRRIAVNINSGPTMWEFVGSNDQECKETSTWTVLCSDMSGKKFDHKNILDNKFCDVEGVTSSFRCLGINILHAPYDVKQYDDYIDGTEKDYADIKISGDLCKAVIKTIRMWEKP